MTSIAPFASTDLPFAISSSLPERLNGDVDASATVAPANASFFVGADEGFDFPWESMPLQGLGYWRVRATTTEALDAAGHGYVDSDKVCEAAMGFWALDAEDALTQALRAPLSQWVCGAGSDGGCGEADGAESENKIASAAHAAASAQDLWFTANSICDDKARRLVWESEQGADPGEAERFRHRLAILRAEKERDELMGLFTPGTKGARTTRGLWLCRARASDLDGTARYSAEVIAHVRANTAAEAFALAERTAQPAFEDRAFLGSTLWINVRMLATANEVAPPV